MAVLLLNNQFSLSRLLYMLGKQFKIYKDALCGYFSLIFWHIVKHDFLKEAS